jgi:hypothetical protein
MARLRHGETASLEDVLTAQNDARDRNRSLGLASAPVRIAGLTSFGYMFRQLQDDGKALLPASQDTVDALIDLGATMNEPGDDPKFDSAIPSAYTYFGQFVAHDITLELQSNDLICKDGSDLEPLPPAVITDQIKNTRSPAIDLDSVYGATADGKPVPRDQAELVVGSVIAEAEGNPGAGPRPRPTNDDGSVDDRSVKDFHNDLPRIDREAQIGDARNDENLITAQMHVAFLRAHNRLVGRGFTFREARRTLTQHFQWLIINDYLPRVVDPEVVKAILTYGNRCYLPGNDTNRLPQYSLYMPLEFSAAAFRFGHSMVRSSYDYNSNFRGETKPRLGQLFTLTALGGNLEGFRRLPEKWIIDWKNFVDSGSNEARMIGPRLVEPLFELHELTGRVADGVRASLAVRNLLRGYLLRLPTGQSVAAALGLPAMTAGQIKRAAADVNPEQVPILERANFLERTPLWYYILAEAADGGSDVLGPVGSTIVAEVLIGLVRWSEDSILSEPGWKPTIGPVPGRFVLKDLFQLAGVWG